MTSISGQVAPGESVSHIFPLKNESGDTLKVRKIVSSCDCTAGTVSSETIPPKSDYTVTVAFTLSIKLIKMKKFIFGGLAIAALAAGGFLLSENRTQAYDLTPAQLSNLDALTDGEDTTLPQPWEECTRIKYSHACYNSSGFCGMAIDEVEKYYKTSLVVICYHYSVRPCPC